MSKSSSNSFHEAQIGQPDETYHIKVEGVEDLELAEAYVQENPGTRVVLDYETPVVSRGWSESDNEEASYVHVRGLGGATSYEDKNSMSVLQSGGCFKDFQEWMIDKAQDAVDGDVYLDRKDVFADTDNGRLDPKVVGFGARMSHANTPNLYGASWREGPVTDELRQIIEEDHTPVLPEEVESTTHYTELTRQIDTTEITELQASERQLPENSTDRKPTSCAVFWRPEEEFNIELDKIQTAVWPWDIS